MKVQSFWTNTVKKIMLILAVITITLGSGQLNNVRASVLQPDTEVTAKTQYGDVIGKRDRYGIAIFKGIPFAKQPVGNLRWKAPQSPEYHSEPIKAFEFGKTSIQPVDTSPYMAASTLPQGEECLTLNIWTRDIQAQNKPVMVFIHGGSYLGGGSGDPYYDLEQFARRADVVMVSINYRVNTLGFLNLEEFGGSEYADSANLGMLDQVQALKWVRENIAGFGGNPNNVTIFGESCGAGSVSVLMGMPSAQGLFQKVIAESGSAGLINRDPEHSKQVARDFIKLTGAKTMDDLLALSPDQIREYQTKFAEMNVSSEQYCFPLVDGRNIPVDPFISIKNGLDSGVKLLIGSNQDEINYWKIYMGDSFYKGAVDGFGKATYKAAGLDLDKHKIEIDRYYKLKNSLNPKEKHPDVNLVNDLGFRMPAIKMAEFQAQYNDAYMYYFKWKSPVRGMGSSHAMELPFVFHNLNVQDDNWLGRQPLPEGLADNMQDAWIAFAATGNPSIPQAPVWKKYDPNGDRATMAIDDKKWELVSDPGRQERLVLDPLYDIYE
ncbi:carboxylesterase/lipase family protein [Sporomusa acidovorans]|uniref:Para-nitrobenzyl esterase n=1 Tax=Sporomusa acidovorans (strain ATCC 49682 / DSM 3132 / Mol) TaxID=1123286 RepID=A0ABZ3JAU8_SPOA4|nr:carboxylesterase family protein [Sporomusa acidovorans]OZC21699.1 para-nitrobenzyl esterase [Sporomusa acidovorans DSM 3132]SDD59770.1 para-nitrobenzyl esterase [Sporomusa acidovorans]